MGGGLRMTTKLLERESFESLMQPLDYGGSEETAVGSHIVQQGPREPLVVLHQAAPMVALMTLGVLNAAPTLAMYKLEASSPRPNAMLAG